MALFLPHRTLLSIVDASSRLYPSLLRSSKGPLSFVVPKSPYPYVVTPGASVGGSTELKSSSL
jgi:hypothetical protein